MLTQHDYLSKHISCKCKCNIDGRTFSSNQLRTTININAGAKKFWICEKDSIWITIICSCKNGNYLATYDQETKTIPTNFNEKRATL